MARKKNLTRTGLPNFLSSALRTVKLKELAERRGKRLHILRKFIERMSIEGDDVDELSKSKLSIEEFAQSIDLKSGTWSRLERAESCLSIEVAEWISVKVLRKFSVFVTSDWLLAENEGTDLPRIINREIFDIYAYLKDIYKAEELSIHLSEEERVSIKDIYTELESSSSITNLDGFKGIVKKYEKELISKTEKDSIDTIIKKAQINKLLNFKDCAVMKAIARRLIISSDISSEEKATRLVLASYFMADLFQKINPESVITYVRDNKMAPVFFKGEVVGGSLISLKNLRAADKKECIIELKNSIKIVRILHYVSNNTIIANTFSNENTPEIYAVDDIQTVALVLFRYKNIERDSLNIDLNNENTPTLIKFEDIRM